MGEPGRWLTHDDQKELFEALVAVALNVVFLALVALLLWPLGRTTLAFRLAKGYGVMWVIVYLTSLSVNGIQRLLRVNLYDHADAYVISNLAASCLLQAGWSAFAALTVHGLVSAAPVGVVVLLYVVGLLSCLVAFFAVSSFYQGQVYKLISLPLALVCFILFSAWPAAARATYGRLFDL